MKTLQDVLSLYKIEAKDVADFGDITIFVPRIDSENIGLLSEQFSNGDRTFFTFCHVDGGWDDNDGAGYVMVVFEKKY